MNNAWRMNENTTYANEKKGWSNKEEQGSAKKVSDNYTEKFGSKKITRQQETTKISSVPENATLVKLRKILRDRGAKGIIGLGKQFKIFDDNNNKTLEYDEFIKAMKDYRVGLSATEIKVLFNVFDRDGTGVIDYDEFLRQIRGEMNQKRVNIVLKAFDKLDLDKGGVIEIDEVKSLYNAKNSKDVLSGKKTEEQVYQEFLETFEAHHNIKSGVKDHRVTQEEFIEYYANISMSIDSDEYFIQMIENSWKLGEQPSYVGKQAWTSGNEHMKKAPRVRGGPPGTFKNAPFGVDDAPTDYSTSKSKPMPFSKKGDEVLIKFRTKIAKRGTRGITSMRRSFKIADDDNSKSIDQNEFKKFCRDYRMDFNDEEVIKLFGIFDRNKNGTIDFDEFMYAIVGEMSDFRVGFVKKAFSIMDKNNNGVLEIDDLRGTYSARGHPDVMSGKKTEDEILAEFLETFEIHFSYLNSKKTKDRKISLEEFIEYYNNISMSIDDDEYFELMMTNAWNLDNKPKYGKGWKREY